MAHQHKQQTPETLDEMRSNCLADDIDIPWPDAQHWSEAEAVRYFESGGMIVPIARQVRDVPAVLAECKLKMHSFLLADEQVHDWLARLRVSRQHLLRRLKVCGVSALSDRQAIVNALAKAWREARVPLAATLPPPPRSSQMVPALPPPVELWRQALLAICKLRKSTTEELRAKLPVGLIGDGAGGSSKGGSGNALDLLSSYELRDEAIARAWSADFFGDVLESLGWPLECVCLLKEGCGLSEGACITPALKVAYCSTVACCMLLLATCLLPACYLLATCCLLPLHRCIQIFPRPLSA